MALAVAAALLLAAPASASVRFSARTFPTAAPFPGYVTSGDVNGDGARDLAATTLGGSVSILLGDGDGRFGAPRSLSLPDLSASAVALGRLNDDGLTDLAIAAQRGGAKTHDRMWLLMGDGAGSFSTFELRDVARGPESISVANLDRDGHADVVAANSQEGSVTVLPGSGGGRFGPERTLGELGVASSLAVADLDGRGGADVVAAGEELVALLNPMRGAARRLRLGGSHEAVATGDLNGDGTRDIVATNALADRVSVVLGGGDGRFLPAQTFRTADSPTGVAVADFDSDGRLDMAVGAASMRVHRGEGDGRLGAGRRVARIGAGSAIAADLDRDGKPDLALADAVSRGVRVLLNRTPPSVRGFTIEPRSFQVGPVAALDAPASDFVYELSTPARVRITIYRCRAHGPCRPRRRGTLRRAGRAGPNRHPFNGRIGTRALAPGRYLASMRVTDAAGDSSGRRRVRFRIVR